LVALSLSSALIESVLYWAIHPWRPIAVFSRQSFKELFGFGNKIMLSGLLNMAHQNIYNLVIGKYFSAAQLGFYTKAVELRDLPSKNFTDVVSRVSYPTLAQVQDEKDTLRAHFSQYMRSTMFISSVLMFGLSAVSISLVEVLIGVQWLLAAEYLQLLCIVGVLYPFHSLNISLIMIKGRSDVILNLGFLKVLMGIPVIGIGIIAGIKAMIGMHSYWTGRLINYGPTAQFRDIFPSILFGILISSPAYLFSLLVSWNALPLLLTQCLISLVSFVLAGEIGRNREYLYLKAQLPILKNKKNE
jgi:O-antigen/teichoic acid export membrane protein